MKRNDVEEFEKLFGQLQGFYEELSILSKKAPNDAVNIFKLKFINKILKTSNNFLGKNYCPFDDFTEFDTDAVPQNSDMVFVLSQYLQSFENFRAGHVKPKYGGWYWIIEPEKGEKADEDGQIRIRTARPQRFKE